MISQLHGRRTAGPAHKNIIVYFPNNIVSSNFMPLIIFLAWKCLYARSDVLHFNVGIQLFLPTLDTFGLGKSSDKGIEN